MSNNQFEQAARAKKVQALVTYFDDFMREAGLGLDPNSDALAMVMTLEQMKDHVWEHHAVVGCGQPKEPSVETKRAVIAVYQGRVVAHEARQGERARSRIAGAVARVAATAIALVVAVGCAAHVEPESKPLEPIQTAEACKGPIAMVLTPAADTTVPEDVMAENHLDTCTEVQNPGIYDEEKLQHYWCCSKISVEQAP